MTTPGGNARLRVAVIGVGHWHLGLYLDPVLALPDTTVVGVSDPDEEVARRQGERVGCTWSTDYRELCATTKPDFVFALGRHVDMAAEATFLAEAGIPFAMEKPCGLDGDEVAEVAAVVRERGAFAAIPFVWRQSELLQTMEERLGPDGLHYGLFRWIAGPASRYLEAGCSWMLDPALSGGGCTVNLGVHFVDLARLLFGPTVELESATMSSSVSGLEIEDYSSLVLASEGRRIVAETGYLYPAPSGEFDMRFSLVGSERYLIATGPNTVEVVEPDMRRESLRVQTTNVPHYRVFVEDVLNRVRQDQRPLASMDDMAAAMRLVDRAYAVARRR